MKTNVDEALSLIEELGTIGAMKWLEKAVQLEITGLSPEIVRLAGVSLKEMPRPVTDWQQAAQVVCKEVVFLGSTERKQDAS
jgi:hypothetical protein